MSTAVPVKPLCSKMVIQILILWMITIGQTAIDIYLPSLPAMVHVLHTSITTMQFSLTAFLIPYACAQFFLGTFSDWYGRRLSLMIGLSFFVVGSLFCAAATGVVSLLCGRALQGIGGGSCSVLSRAILRDVFSGNDLNRIASYFAVVWSLVPLIAPVVGGYLQHLAGFRVIFLLLALIGVLALTIYYFFLPETHPPQTRVLRTWRTVFANYYVVLQNKSYLGYVWMVFVLYGIFVGFNVAGPFLFENLLAFSPVQYGWVLLLIGAGYLLGSIANSLLVRYVSPKYLSSLGLFFSALCAILALMFSLAHVLSFTVIAIPLFFLFLSLGCVYPNCMSGSMEAFPELAGTASAIFGGLALFGGAAASMVIAWLPETSQTPFFLVTILQIFIAIVLFFKLALSDKGALQCQLS